MQKGIVQKGSKVAAASLSLAALFLPAIASATVYSTVYNNIFSNAGNSSGIACTSCHHSSLVGAVARHAAPEDTDGAGPITGADFDVYELAAARVTTMVSYTDPAQWTGDAYMPMDPNQADFTYIGVPDLNASDRASIADWEADGAPFAAATVSTSTATSITKTTATLRASVNPNVHAATTVPGTAYFNYGLTTSYTDTTTAITGLTGTSGTTQSTGISGLKCGTSYHFRGRASNGHNTATGSDQSFSTSACDDPVFAGVTIVADATTQSTNEDTNKDFALTVSNVDPGSLQWSKTNGAKGTVTLIGATNTAFNGSATVRYAPTANQSGADSFTVTVNNMNSGTSRTVTFNMTIIAINDQPAITSIAPASAIEDTQYSYQVVVNDPDDSFPAGLSIALTNEPGGMAVNTNGLITWTPGNGVSTSGLVTVSVDDGHENGTVQVTQQFTVSVTGTNDPPVITPGATTAATEDVQYSYQMQVTDIDDFNNGTDISFTFSPPGSEPTGMVISSTGLITWTPLEGVTTSGLVTVEVEDGDEDVSAPDSESFTITVTQVNDSPVVTPGAPTTVNEEDSYSYQIVVNDDDDLNDGTQLSFTPTNFPTGMAVSTTGLITWTVPRTGADITHNTITVTVADGGEDSATTSAEVFNLAVSIVDTDNDTVADYADNCPTVANAGQEDLDNDTVRILPQTDPNNYPPEGDVDPTARDAVNALAESYLRGGDACDEDIDGDGLSNDFENTYAFLDPMDAADAAADEDGDGVTNLEEFLASTAPDVDSVAPTVNAPSDITVDATGLLTSVSLGAATGSDGNDGDSSIFKAAVNLTAAELAALDAAVTGCQLLSNYETDIEAFRPGSHTVTWATCDASGNPGRDNQTVNVKPLVSVTSGQSVGEGQPVNIDVVLNGDAVAYPAKVKYTMTGTAVPIDDHDGSSGEVTFNNPGDIATISFNTVADVITESDETVVVTLHTPSNMALSNRKLHTVTITEANVSPQATLAVTQPNAVLDVNKGHTLYQADGVARVVADANDGNGDTLSFDWSASDPALLAVATISSSQIDFDPNVLTAGGLYNAKVTVSDAQSSVTVERLLLVKAGEVNIWLVGDDDDGDGIDNLSEGYGDDDADGIPNYLDHVSTPANVIPNHTVNLASSLLIETDPGLHIAKGETAVAAQTTGVLIGMQDILDHGGAGGGAVVNADTEHTFYSGLLNFEISGLTDDIESVNVVIPLHSAIQEGSVYRKYNSTGWFDFIEDDYNVLRSAAGNDGSCPQPGSNLYTPGLTVGHLCLQLTIQDGGSNDADGIRNYIVKDPGGLALVPEVEEAPAASDDSGRVGSLSLWFMLLLSMTVVVYKRYSGVSKKH